MLSEVKPIARWLNLAEWHSREVIIREAIGDAEGADYHLNAAHEYLSLSGLVCLMRDLSGADLAGICADLKDSVGVV